MTMLHPLRSSPLPLERTTTPLQEGAIQAEAADIRGRVCQQLALVVMDAALAAHDALVAANERYVPTPAQQLKLGGWRGLLARARGGLHGPHAHLLRPGSGREVVVCGSGRVGREVGGSRREVVVCGSGREVVVCTGGLSRAKLGPVLLTCVSQLECDSY